ncbi:MAG: hypothetical protein QM765_35425 [Myxococcales bacterium]
MAIASTISEVFSLSSEGKCVSVTFSGENWTSRFSTDTKVSASTLTEPGFGSDEPLGR